MNEIEKSHKMQLGRAMASAERMEIYLSFDDLAPHMQPLRDWFTSQPQINIDNHHFAVKCPDGRVLCWDDIDNDVVAYNSIEGYKEHLETKAELEAIPENEPPDGTDEL